jgi:hypothetical protein
VHAISRLCRGDYITQLKWLLPHLFQYSTKKNYFNNNDAHPRNYHSLLIPNYALCWYSSALPLKLSCGEVFSIINPPTSMIPIKKFLMQVDKFWKILSKCVQGGSSSFFAKTQTFAISHAYDYWVFFLCIWEVSIL